MSNHINEILFALSDAPVEFILGGGVAAVLHGVERVTLDVDIALKMDEANVEKFLQVMTQLSLHPRAPVPASDLMSPDAVRRMVKEKHALVFSFIDRDNPLRHIDVFLTKDLSFDEMKTDAQDVNVQGRTIKVMSASRLLRLKRAIQPPRDKDIFDIKALENLVGGSK